jgi:hypothetical protein
MPGTQYNAEIIAAFRSEESTIIGRDARADQYVKKGICDAGGRFSFSGLSARPWIVVVDVTWSVPGENGLERQGGVLSKTVDADAGTTEVILSGADQIP